MTNPTNLKYCKIYGNFKAFVADMGADSDDLPDFVPMSGYGKIWPNVEIARNIETGEKSTYFNTPIDIVVDADGDISLDGVKHVMVLATSPNLTPTDFTYSILLTLWAKDESKARTYGPYAFNVTPDGEVDITDAMPVAESAGVPIITGPQGPQGIQGPQGLQGVGIPSGGSPLQIMRKNAANTLAEWATLTKTDVGLNNVDNTSDVNKPVSTAQQTAINAKESSIAAGTTAQYWRGDKTWQTLNKAAVGLSNVDNTADTAKPVSTAQQTALNAKEGTITAGTTSQFWRGDKTWVTPDKNSVGLTNVDNTSDINKPVSTATQNALNLKLDASKTIYWQPNTAYALGQVVLSPGGDLVKSKVAHTSGTTYSGIGTNWASVEQGQSVILKTNLTKNTRAAVDLTDFVSTAGGGTPTQARIATGGPTESATFMRATAATAGWTYVDVRSAGTTTNLVTAGSTYTMSGSIRSSMAGTVTLYIQWADSGGSILSTSTSVSQGSIPVNTWQRYSFSGVAPTNAVRAILIFRVNGTTAVNDTVDLTAVQLENSASATAFFDGANASSGDYLYSWTGAANASTSTLALTSTGFVAKWAPNTFYSAGQQVVSPNNDIVSAKVDFTSGPTFSQTNWNFGSESYAKGLVARTRTTATQSGISQSGSPYIVLNIPSVTFKANRNYRISWIGNYYMLDTATTFVFGISYCSTADAFASNTGLTQITADADRPNAAQEGRRIKPSLTFSTTTDQTLQLKVWVQRVSGTSTLTLSADSTNPMEITVEDLGALI